MIYFDAAAAAPPDPAVLDFHREAAARWYGNQESAHTFARSIRQQMDEAARQLAQLLADDTFEVLWADSGTSLFPLLTSLPELRGHSCFCDLVHPALQAAVRHNMRPAAAPDQTVRLIAGSHVESETGRLTDMARLRPEGMPALLLADTIQSAGKLPLPAADFLTVSGHKLGAPGAALLYRDPDGKRRAFFEQQRSRDYHLGRPDPAAILTLVFAVEQAYSRMEENRCQAVRINDFLRRELAAIPLRGGKYPVPTLPPEAASPYILHLLLPGMQGGVVVRMLSEYDICAASGSACQAETDQPSPALLALGYSRNEAYSGLRLSFSPSNTLEEAAAFAAAFRKIATDY